MDPKEARRRSREVAGLAAALTVRLRVLEESRGAIHLATDAGDPSILGLWAGGDVESLVLLVMMEAAAAEQDDLRAIMAEVLAVNAAKKRLRKDMGLVAGRASSRHPADARRDSTEPDAVLEVFLTAYGIGIEHEVDQLIDDIDSMSEMGEMESLRLQMAMDRISKMMGALSNLMKKLSDTSQQVVQNMK